MKIKNFEQLAVTPLRKQALLIAESGLAAVEPKTVINRELVYNRVSGVLNVGGKDYQLTLFRRVIVVGFGKAAFSAVESIQEILGAAITCGFVIDLRGGNLGNHIVCKIGTHPLPTLVNVEATGELMEMLSNSTAADFIICVVSGGGSSLLCKPLEMSCETQSLIIHTLMNKGANIYEINTVRKHISQVKGGQLAKICYPATMVNLIFSDVPGGNLSMVASGPTVRDTTTILDAQVVLKKYKILELCQLPSCALVETPKDETYFSKVQNVLVAGADTAIRAMRNKAKDLGFSVRVSGNAFQGEARSLGAEFAKEVQPGECLLAAGESTVKVTGKGKGGRNQEMALSALPLVSENQVFLTLASDGFDNTPVAGAIVDSSTLRHAQQSHLDIEQYLTDNNSYTFFQEVGDYIDTGLTGSNVADLVVSLRN